MKPEIKICGLTSVDDVIDAQMLGASYLGFILYAARSGLFRKKDSARSRTFCRRRPSASACLSMRRRAEIFAPVEAGLIDIVQLHGDETPAFAEKISGKIPVWKAVCLNTDEDVERAAQFPATRLLVDSAGGGTGVPCNWELAAKISARRAIMLAGGITPENAGNAVRAVNPAGIDISSGVESRVGIKSFQKMKQLFETFNRNQ